MDFSTLGGNLLGTILLVILYCTSHLLICFYLPVMLGFTLLIAVSKTETS